MDGGFCERKAGRIGVLVVGSQRSRQRSGRHTLSPELAGRALPDPPDALLDVAAPAHPSMRREESPDG